MKLEFEIFHGAQWNLAGSVEIRSADSGFLSESTLTYELDYWTNNAALEMRDDKVVKDIRAASISDSLDLGNHYRKTWPP